MYFSEQTPIYRKNKNILKNTHFSITKHIKHVKYVLYHILYICISF